MFGLSQRDRAEVTRSEAEQRYRVLVDSANDAIFTVDSAGTITSLNRAFERMTGWDREDSVGRSFAPLVHPEDLPSVMEVFNQALGGSLLPHYEVRVLTRSGAFIVVEVTSSPLYEDGSIVGFLGVARDVTERKQAEEELHRRGRILEAVAFVSERFMAGSTEDVGEVLGRLGTAAGADSIAVFQNVLSEDGDLLTSARHTWTTPDLDSLHGRLDAELQGFGYHASGLDRWVEVLGAGGVIIGHLRDFPPAEQHFLEPWGVRSLVVVPIFVADEWWGTVGFAQVREDRTWSTTEIGALRTAAGILGATIQQDRASRALREAEDQYRRLVELSPDAILVLRKGVIEFANRSAARLIGAASAEHLLGTSLLMYVHADSRTQVLTQLQDLQGGRPIPLVAQRLTRLDGSPVDVEVAATPFHYEGEAAVQMVARDATDRVRAEEALRASEEQLRQAEAKFRTLVERIPAITYTAHFGEEGRWLYVSPQIEAILGFTPEEWMSVPHRWFSQVYPEDRERILKVEEDSRHTGEAMQCEYRLMAKDGHVAWVRDDWVVDRTESGDPVLQGVIFDITDRKKAEEDLERALSIEREAAERLRALDEMKNTFLHAVSHELRTPLSAVLGLAVTLEREEVQLPAEERLDLVRRLSANARKLDQLLSDLLDLDRLDRGIMEPRRRPTDVAALVRRTVENSDILGTRPVRVAAQLVVVSVDAPKVERIVENLLANAARHTPPGTTIWVGVSPQQGGVLLSVEDDGPGISEKLRDSIFEPFRQGPDASSHSPGVGIGLSLVAKFAELHGGRAWVDERPGGGASFKVFLPGAAA